LQPDNIQGQFEKYEKKYEAFQDSGQTIIVLVPFSAASDELAVFFDHQISICFYEYGESREEIGKRLETHRRFTLRCPGKMLFSK